MNRKLTIMVLSAAACLASQARAQDEYNQYGYQNGVREPESGSIIPGDPGRLPPEPEARAEDLKLHGKCEQAIPIFHALAVQGTGYEISQYNLGLCLFDIGKTEPDTQRALSLKHEAVEWILEAANNSFPDAQLSLVTIYLDGNGVDSDPVEAGKWSLIYRANGARFTFGLPNISSDLQARLDSLLTEKTWLEAQSRAAAWSPTSQNGVANK